MKKTLAKISGLLIISISCQAQETEVDGGKTYQHDFGFNTLFLINQFQSRSTPFTILYKKSLRANKAMRLGLNAAMSISDPDANIQGTNAVYNRSSNYNIGLYIGKEFQHQAGKRWIWYAGADFVPSIFREYNEGLVANQK